MTTRRRLPGFLISLLLCGFVLSSAGSSLIRAERAKDRPPRRLQDAAREIDRLIQLDLADAGIAAMPQVDDGGFLRRVYLDVVGRIPSAAETRAFLDSRSPTKREQLIDDLLASPGRVSNDFNYWADLFRVKSRFSNVVSGEPFMDWLKKAIAANLPYDRMVRELLTATGPAHARDHGATGYLLRDFNMPHDNVANTMRIFLGTRIECAQCHNHPFESWTQRQFFELAAFQGGIRYRSDAFDQGRARELAQASRQLRSAGSEQAFRYIRRQYQLLLSPGISGSGSGLERLPADYRYDDAEPEAWVTAGSLLGKTVRLEVEAPAERRFGNRRRAEAARLERFRRQPDNDSRAVYAAWLTAADNPRFTTVIVNRLWEKLFGRGLIDPVDDIKDDTVAVNFELLSYLEELMVDLDFDLVAFQKAILLSRSYQREAVARDLAPGEPYHFEGPLMRRLSAAQFWDSMVTLVVKDIDSTITLGTSTRAEQIYRNYEQAAAKDVQQILAEAEKVGQGGAGARQAMRERMGDQQGEARRLIRDYYQALRRKDEAAAAKAQDELEAMGVDLDRLQLRRRYGNDMLRASELPQPAPAGHFLRDFGQSDREQIAAGFDDATVPQVLNLLNGFLEDNLFTKQQGELLSSIRAARDPEQKIRIAYLSVLSRRPSKAEIASWRDELRQGGEEVLRDLVWTLVNCHEFRFQR